MYVSASSCEARLASSGSDVLAHLSSAAEGLGSAVLVGKPPRFDTTLKFPVVMFQDPFNVSNERIGHVGLVLEITKKSKFRIVNGLNLGGQLVSVMCLG